MWRLIEIAQKLDVECVGEGSVEIAQIATLEKATPECLSFLTNSRYRSQLASTRAAAVIVSESDRDATTLPRLISKNPYLTYALAAQLLNPEERPLPGIHPTAVVDASAQLAADVSVGPFAIVGPEARLDAGAVVGAHGSVGARVHLGAATRLMDGVTIYQDCKLGQRCLVHSGVVIGADGFGMAWSGERWIKIPQTGRVLIGDDVEIGANTTIDRGALDDTVIEEGVKLDNLIQIAHNVRIGAHTVIAGCAGISGSTHVGRYCRIGGGVGIVGHVEICDHATISGFSLITKSITEPGVYTSSIPSQPHKEWMETLATLRGLPRFKKKMDAALHLLDRHKEEGTS
jgi:UDP-3-O-[3-hydroxymyristoyl] glucosamine N-acyltransferase